MATTKISSQCYSCSKETRTFLCQGCEQNFCFDDLTKHLQDLHKELETIENDHDQFRQIINDQKENPDQYSLMKEIDQWENDSINKIKQTAKECREQVIDFRNKYLTIFENKLNNLVKKIKEIRPKNQFNEFDLNQIKRELNKINKEFEKPKNISIKEDSSEFIHQIFVVLPIDGDQKWKQHGMTIIGQNQAGIQLYTPCGAVFDNHQNMFVADYSNHRIVKWKLNSTNGQIVLDGYENQLKYPIDMTIDKEDNSLIIADQGNRRVIRCSLQNNKNQQILISNIDCFGVTMDKNGSLYVADYKKNEVIQLKKGDQEGKTVSGGNGRGNGLNQLDNPTFIFVDENYSLFISDQNNHRVIKWIKDAKEGIVVAGGNGQGNRLTQLSGPRGIIVDQLGQIYVTDCFNDRVMRWCEGCKEGTIVVGGNKRGQESNQLNCPRGLSFDEEGNLYVIDYGNDRIQKFEMI